jgi:hypothetical protein
MHGSGLEDHKSLKLTPDMFLRPKFESLDCIGLYAKLISRTDRVTWIVSLS